MAIDKGSLSSSLSLFNKPFAALTVNGVSSFVLLFSETTVGASLTAITDIPITPWLLETKPLLSSTV